MAAMTKPGTETFEGPREHQSYRLDGRLISIIEDIATGVDEGEAGLKSCTMGAMSVAASGASAAEVNATHHRDVAVIDDEDECFDLIGTYLAQGFSHNEVRKMVRLGGGSTKLLAVERWCDRVHLTCDADQEPPKWGSSALNERRQRGRRAMSLLRQSAAGCTHASVLHVVYGWRDPFVNTLPIEIVAALGRELLPLARYTDTVEDRRLEMARAEAQRGTRAYVPASERVTKMHPHEEQLIGLTAAIASAHETNEIFRLAAKHGERGAPQRKTVTKEEGYKLFDLERHRSLLHHAERALTSGDALRAAAAPFNEPNSPQADDELRAAFEARKDERDERKKRHYERSSAFLLQVKLDANRMLTDASNAFHGAWQRS